MIEPNMKLLEAMRDEANLCYKRGDDEDGNALVKSIFDQIFPVTFFLLKLLLDLLKL